MSDQGRPGAARAAKNMAFCYNLIHSWNSFPFNLEPSLLFSPIFGPIWAVTVTAVASSGCHHSDGAPARRQWGVRSYFHFAFLHHLLHDNFGCHCFHFIAQNKLESNTLKLVEAFSDYFQRRLMS